MTIIYNRYVCTFYVEKEINRETWSEWKRESFVSDAAERTCINWKSFKVVSVVLLAFCWFSVYNHHSPGSGIFARGLSGSRIPFCTSSSLLARTDIFLSSAKNEEKLEKKNSLLFVEQLTFGSSFEFLAFLFPSPFPRLEESP